MIKNKNVSTLKLLLIKALAMIEEGEFDDITTEQLEEISIIIHRPITVGREDAAKFLGLSLNRFHELRDEGVIQLPRCVKGQKEKLYYMSDLRKSLEIIKLRNKKTH